MLLTWMYNKSTSTVRVNQRHPHKTNTAIVVITCKLLNYVTHTVSSRNTYKPVTYTTRYSFNSSISCTHEQYAIDWVYSEGHTVMLQVFEFE